MYVCVRLAPACNRTTEENPPRRVSGSTNKENPMQTEGGTKSAVDDRLITW